MKRLALTLSVIVAFVVCEKAFPADVVPAVVQMPGTQPTEVSNLESPDKCDNCHGGYNSAVEPAHNWRGSMMALAGRDPIFWATMAVAEQDFDGAGDLCLRCHSTGGWLAGRSTPTDGSGLAAGDSDGVECDFCHKLTNPDDSEYQGVMNAPFIANDGGNPAEGYYGSGMSSLWNGADKLGPFLDADARHQFMRSEFHRKPEFCGSCHDVSNPVTGELAPNHGAFYDPNATQSVAFNNPPYRYGIVERTFSEHMSSALPTTRVDAFASSSEMPRGGAMEAIYEATWDPDRMTADYEDGAPRYYTCQTCHMRAVTGAGANKHGVPMRSDLPLHDMTGGNYWMADAIEYLDQQGKLRLGGGMTSGQIQAMRDGALRALEQLQLAATLDLTGNTLRVTNHTGHKLVTGYPEGRRMWVRARWLDASGTLLREDGAYGNLDVLIDGVTTTVRTLLDPEARVYEAHMGMTREWAERLRTLGYSADLPLAYDRVSGAPVLTLAALATGQDTAAETFHFALNNTVVRDNRIPPYGMRSEEAQRRNAGPVGTDQYGTGGVYRHYDEFDLNPPADAVSAQIELLYQPTSWEYIQFLYLANDRNNAFLGDEGANMLEAWRATGMAEPVVIASTEWGTSVGDGDCSVSAPTLTRADVLDKSVLLEWQAAGSPASYNLYYDQSGKAQLFASVDCTLDTCGFTDTGLTNGQTYCYKVTASEGICESGFSNILCAIPQPPGQQTEPLTAAVIDIGRYIVSGKGNNRTMEWQSSDIFAAGEEVVVRLRASDLTGTPVSGATVDVAILGPTAADVSGTSDSNGIAEVAWLTSKPKRNGDGGTPPGDYAAVVSGVTANGYSWDGADARVTFQIQP